MKVHVIDHQTDRDKLYEGTREHVEELLLFDYPWLRTDDPQDRGDLEAVMEHLDATAAFEVDVEDEGDPALEKAEDPSKYVSAEVVGDQLGFQPEHSDAFQAARWMSGGSHASLDAIRAALYENDGNFEVAALRAYGFEPSEENLQALRSVQKMVALNKSEPIFATAGAVVAGHAEAEDVAEGIRRAYADKFVFPVALSGKHSKGSLVARDQKEQKTWLLKPGSGGAGVAAGSSEETASQSAREAAWYHVVKEWGLYRWYPRAELMFIDGKTYAAMELLPWSFKTIEKKRVEDPVAPRRILGPFLSDGLVHQWAIADYVLGNPDSHGQNLMTDDEGDVKLIDHGSAFAGDDFDPAHDKNSFVPYALRAWAPRSFNTLSTEDKLHYLPRLNPEVAARIGKWVAQISSAHLEAVCHRYGIDPTPTTKRLALLKERATQMPVDKAINELWVTT